MELCEQQPTRQFLFITPQGMHPFLVGRKKVPNIIKMSASLPSSTPPFHHAPRAPPVSRPRPV